jgi:ribosomal protein S18 acetylase RimI-like enzyme
VTRAGKPADLDTLLDLEAKVFSSDRMSRRSLRHFLVSRTAKVIVAETGGAIAGCAVVLFRPNSILSRLYSIAVDPAQCGRGIGPALLAASETAAIARGCHVQRLEVHQRNKRAIQLYRKSGYQQFGRYERYYDDKAAALRFEKLLRTPAPKRVSPWRLTAARSLVRRRTSSQLAGRATGGVALPRSSR